MADWKLTALLLKRPREEEVDRGVPCRFRLHPISRAQYPNMGLRVTNGSEGASTMRPVLPNSWTSLLPPPPRGGGGGSHRSINERGPWGGRSQIRNRENFAG